MPRLESSIVEVCIFKRTRGGPAFLMLRRAKTEKVYPGMWQIVTGKIKRGEKAVWAAVRELREETGLQPAHLWIAPIVGSFFDAGRDTVHMCPLFIAEVKEQAEPVLSKEHEAFEWAIPDRAHELLVWPGHHNAVRVALEYIIPGGEAAILSEQKTRKSLKGT